MSSGANVNLTVVTGGERYGHFRSGSRTDVQCAVMHVGPTSPLLPSSNGPLRRMVTQIARALDQTRTLAAHIAAHIKELRGREPEVDAAGG